MAEEPANGKSSDPGGEADERLQKVVEKIERELDATFEGRLDELEEAARRAKANRLHAEDHEFEGRLSQLETKAKTAKGRNEEVGTLISERRLKQAEDYRGLGVGLGIAYMIVGLPLLGAGVGWFIDRSSGTTQAMGFGALIGAAVGMGMALMMLNRQNRG